MSDRVYLSVGLLPEDRDLLAQVAARVGCKPARLVRLAVERLLEHSVTEILAFLQGQEDEERVGAFDLPLAAVEAGPVKPSGPPTVIARRTGHGVVVLCPYCGREHVHGPAAGHRPAPCGAGVGYVIVLP